MPRLGPIGSWPLFLDAVHLIQKGFPVSDHDSNFVKTFSGVLVGLSVLAFVLYFAAQYVIDESGINNTSEADQFRSVAVDKRIASIGRVHLMGDKIEAASAAPAAPRSIDDIVSGTCGGCHNSGVMGAPKIGTKADWDSRYANGVAGLLENAINGLNGMPPRGGAADLTDDQLEASIIKMLQDSGFDIASPATETKAAPSVETTAPVAQTQAPAQAEEATNPISKAMNAMSNAVSSAADTASAAATSTVAAVSDAASATVDAVSASSNDQGKAIYERACVACHSAGVAGAPRLGDANAWAARIDQGMDTLNDHALQGFRGMPPKGGRMDLSDAEVTAAVSYMVDSSK